MPAYEILAKLAQGATAELFAARATDRVVVLKRLRASGVDAAKAFLAESLVAATLDHPNIVKVFDVGALHGAYVVTREYVDGETLASLVAHARHKKIQVPLRAILTIAAGTAEGLQYAHERSMHADLSLPSVIVSHDGVVKLLEVSGADRSGDLVALGRMLWELLTLGDPSTSPENPAALPLPSKSRFDIPQELDTIVVRLLAGEFESADEVMGAIDLLGAKLGFQLSTAELSRMMRLWYAAPPESPQQPLVPVPVTTEPVGHDAAPAVAEPTSADDPLAAVRDDDDARHAVAALVTTRLRHDRITAVPGFGEVDATREHFEKIRDRILEHARKKKETRPPIPTGAFPSNAFAPARPESEAPFAVAIESTPPPGSVAVDAPNRRKPDTLDPDHNPYAYITKVAATATAPTKSITKGEVSAANAALEAASHAADEPSDAPPVTGRVSTLRMGEVVARPAPQTEPRVVESSPVKLGPDIAAENASSKPPGDAAAARGTSPEDETVVVDEGALPRSGQPAPLASVAAERLGDARSPHTRRTAEMVAIDVKAEDARAALVDARSPDVKARENAKTTAQIKAVDVQDIANFEADAARLAYAKSIDESAKSGGAAVSSESSAIGALASEEKAEVSSRDARTVAGEAATTSSSSMDAREPKAPSEATASSDAKTTSSASASEAKASSDAKPSDAKPS
ncbi:MAG: protein kinase, partial [Kofleriaceae bacterium]|nr:protein kinase [Kofleriaceae bacterium]